MGPVKKPAVRKQKPRTEAIVTDRGYPPARRLSTGKSRASDSHVPVSVYVIDASAGWRGAGRGHGLHTLTHRRCVGATGHRIVGTLAELHLKDLRALKEIRRILPQGQTLADASVWPDTIKDPLYEDPDTAIFRLNHPAQRVTQRRIPEPLAAPGVRR